MRLTLSKRNCHRPSCLFKSIIPGRRAVVYSWRHGSFADSSLLFTRTGFSLLLLYLYYLQVGCTPPVVPQLQSKYSEHFTETVPISTIIDHLKTGHQPEELKNFVSQNKQNLGELFVGFFRFYKNFDWSTVISIRRSNAYVSNRRPHMKIEDPYELGGNSARGIYEWYGFWEIKKAFSKALEKLEDDLSLENLL